MDESVLVEVKSISRRFGDLDAIKNVSFTVDKGQVLGFLGPNGAGKTTTMQIITGNLAPSSGEVMIAGHDLLDDPRAAKAAIGYLPEQPPVYPDLSVDEYLDYCAALNAIVKSERLQARETAKEKCGLTKVGHRQIGNLSKGYQQRVGIAQAVIHMPPVVILDEPTVGLDPIQIREIRQLIRELGKDHAVILSTHILPEVQSACDYVQIINAGELVLHDSIDGLNKHMRAASVTVAFQKGQDVSQLKTIKGVKSTHEEGEGRIRVFHEPDTDPTQAIIEMASANQWGLYEIRPGRVSLEEIFLELTTDEHADNAQEQAEQEAS
jgi:ABC-2 type transport system ATP-binding protein